MFSICISLITIRLNYTQALNKKLLNNDSYFKRLPLLKYSSN